MIPAAFDYVAPTSVEDAVAGALAGSQLGKGHQDRGWAIGLGTLAGAMIGNYEAEAGW